MSSSANVLRQPSAAQSYFMDLTCELPAIGDASRRIEMSSSTKVLQQASAAKSYPVDLICVLPAIAAPVIEMPSLANDPKQPSVAKDSQRSSVAKSDSAQDLPANYAALEFRMSSSAKAPQLPYAAKPYVVALALDHPTNYASIISTMLCFIGVMFGIKLCSWFGALFGARALVNLKNLENDFVGIAMATAFAIIALWVNYTGPGTMLW